MRHPFSHNHLLERFLEKADRFDYVVANGDYSCNSAFVGMCDEAAYQSAAECLGKLRQKLGARLLVNCGDHELGKVTFGRRGGMRLASWRRVTKELGLTPFWQLELGDYVLLGVVSSLVALPMFESDTLPEERQEWRRLRAEHLAQIREAFASLGPRQKVLLFCHDPTALPFLWREEAVRAKLPQIEWTTIGHLHSNLVFWKGRMLAGMPRVGFPGSVLKKVSSALNEAGHWRPFHVRLCPALAGIEAWPDGGYCTIELEPEGSRGSRFRRHRLVRGKRSAGVVE